MAVDPERVPLRKLSSGAAVPAIGLGTFGSDHVPADEVAEAVAGALEVGYRHFDCASVYANEAEIGCVLKDFPREQLWVTSKLWNDSHGPEDVLKSCRQSIEDLQVQYLDMYLVHWPFPNHHDPGVDVTSRSANARPYVHEKFMATWRQMEGLVDIGLVRHIGTSNMTIPKMELVLRDARIAPEANEMELHPHFQQPEFFSYLVGKGVQPIGFCPIGSPQRPERDKAPDDTVDIEDPLLVRIAHRLGVHPAVVCVKWAAQRGQIPIPFSTKRSHYEANLDAVAGDPLTDQEMSAIAAVDRGNRLIKGHVFLWREGQTWEDLWDLDGVIRQ